MTARAGGRERSESVLTPKLAVVGLVAGLASGLLGVGGGILIVPLLVYWAGYAQREAPRLVARGDRADRHRGPRDLRRRGKGRPRRRGRDVLQLRYAGFLGPVGLRVLRDGLRTA